MTEEEKQALEEKLKNAKRVIIENLPTDLGITEKELQMDLMKRLEDLGDKSVVITDVDLNYSPNSVSV